VAGGGPGHDVRVITAPPLLSANGRFPSHYRGWRYRSEELDGVVRVQARTDLRAAKRPTGRAPDSSITALSPLTSAAPLIAQAAALAAAPDVFRRAFTYVGGGKWRSSRGGSSFAHGSIIQDFELDAALRARTAAKPIAVPPDGPPPKIGSCARSTAFSP